MDSYEKVPNKEPVDSYEEDPNKEPMDSYEEVLTWPKCIPESVRVCALFWGPFLMKPNPDLMFNSNEAQFGSMALCINNNINS